MSRWSDTCCTALIAPFRSGGRLNIPVICLFAAINGLVLVNACLHDPRVGYDATEHLAYIRALSDGRLVDREDSDEFFSPPLPYAFPALLMGVAGVDALAAAGAAQAANVLASLALTFYLLNVCGLVSSRPALKTGALACLGVLPVYYKSFAFVRGEPYVAAFGVILVYHALRLFADNRCSCARSVALGVAMGLCALSRQWGILLFPAVILAVGCRALRSREHARQTAIALALAVATAAVVSGWFYLSLRMRYGSSTAFNRKRAEAFSPANQPGSFYFSLHVHDLFRRPFRPHFANRLLPMFYSEIWGDYWGDFVVYGFDTQDRRFVSGANLHRRLSRQTADRANLDTNYPAILDYLGRVNAVSLYPSALLLASVAAACVRVWRQRNRYRSADARFGADLLSLGAIAGSLAGYLGFLVMYPNLGKGDTIKATYMLQVFPLVALMGGRLLEGIEGRKRTVYLAALAALAVVAAHHAPAMVTHYPMPRTADRSIAGGAHAAGEAARPAGPFPSVDDAASKRTRAMDWRTDRVREGL